jgi:hypothetical protein
VIVESFYCGKCVTIGVTASSVMAQQVPSTELSVPQGSMHFRIANPKSNLAGSLKEERLAVASLFGQRSQIGQQWGPAYDSVQFGSHQVNRFHQNTTKISLFYARVILHLRNL